MNMVSSSIGSFLRKLNTRAAAVVHAASSASSASSQSSPRLAPIVGITDVVTKDTAIPVRIFYPSTAAKQGNVSWFVRGYAYFIDGYLHTLQASLRESTAMLTLMVWLSYLISWIFPMGNAFLPNCAYDAPPMPPPVPRGKYPLIMFSHGLTGSGEEHALMFARWAQMGYVVASVHHCDGSSAKAPQQGGDSPLLYDHPDLSKYDKEFRPRQIQKRESELFDGREYILNDPSFPKDIRNIIDDKVVIVGGFSYGAATAALSITKRKGAYTAALLLDGWFYIDLGEGMVFPTEVHTQGLDIPTIFIGSEHFANWKTCANATAELVKKNSHSVGSVYHLIQGTRHQNFTDLGFWLPVYLLKKLNMIGSCDYDGKYDEVLDLTLSFFKLHSSGSTK
jgi:predicted esterase